MEKLKSSQFEILGNLGEGAFGLVNKVKRIKDGKIFAMKKVNLKNMNEELKKLCRNETQVLKDVIHENIIK